MNGPLKFLTARKSLPLLDLLAKNKTSARSAHGAFMGRVFNKNGLEALGFFQRRLFLFELKCSMRRVIKAFTFTLLT